MRKRTRINKKKLNSYTLIEEWFFPIFVACIFGLILLVMFLSIVLD